MDGDLFELCCNHPKQYGRLPRFSRFELIATPCLLQKATRGHSHRVSQSKSHVFKACVCVGPRFSRLGCCPWGSLCYITYMYMTISYT